MKEGAGVLVIAIVIAIGMVIILAGIILVFYSVSVDFPSGYDYYNNRVIYIPIRVYPYQRVGMIVCLIGFVTAIIGGALASISERINRRN